MKRCNRSISTAAAGLGASALALTAIVPAMYAYADTGSGGLDIAEVIGPSGHPIPGDVYVADAFSQYLNNTNTQTVDGMTIHTITPA